MLLTAIIIVRQFLVGFSCPCMGEVGRDGGAVCTYVRNKGLFVLVLLWFYEPALPGTMS